MNPEESVSGLEGLEEDSPDFPERRLYGNLLRRDLDYRVSRPQQEWETDDRLRRSGRFVNRQSS